jgi:solute carrier family 25 carnitine/acylcarnitine transporter 20/29
MDNETSVKQRVKDFTSGTAGGIAQVLIGQPFDRIKVILQSQSGQYNGTLDCARQIYKKEGGIAAFYKGTLTPLLGVGLCVSIQFAAFQDCRRRLEKRNVREGRVASLSYSQYYLAGAFAGIANAFVSSPVEQIRIMLQTQPHEQKLYNGPWDCAKKLYEQKGIAGGVFRGFGITLLREAQAYGAWFCTYEFLMQQTIKSGVKREEIPMWKLLTFGAIAGEVLWLASYPLDVIKSRIQSDSLAQPRYRGVLDCARQTWREGRFRAFWKGIVPTVLRATPASAGTFATVELAIRLMG